MPCFYASPCKLLTEARVSGVGVDAQTVCSFRTLIRHGRLIRNNAPTFSVTSPIQVNIQLGEFTLRRHTMETLPQSIESHPDFQAIFGLAEDSSRWEERDWSYPPSV